MSITSIMKSRLKRFKSPVNIYRVVLVSIYNVFWFPYIQLYKLKNRNSSNIVFCECYVKYLFYQIRKNNWGDDINKYFMEYITNNKFVFVPFSKLSIKEKGIHYSLIGSIIGFYNLNNTIIYGSGIKNPNVKLKGTPRKIYSVRGPLTRSVLINNGIQCPKHYGDPVLLLPLFYQPDRERKSSICIIPNMGTNSNAGRSIIEYLTTEYKCNLINMTSYKHWKNIIDEIVSSSFVISESLHGLIVAETYGVPSVWVEFVEHESWWGFKFQDFYESIGKKNMQSIKLYQDYSWDEIISQKAKWNARLIDYQEMLRYFPFDLQEDVLIIN